MRSFFFLRNFIKFDRSSLNFVSLRVGLLRLFESYFISVNEKLGHLRIEKGPLLRVPGSLCLCVASAVTALLSFLMPSRFPSTTEGVAAVTADPADVQATDVVVQAHDALQGSGLKLLWQITMTVTKLSLLSLAPPLTLVLTLCFVLPGRFLLHLDQNPDTEVGSRSSVLLNVLHQNLSTRVK